MSSDLTSEVLLIDRELQQLQQQIEELQKRQSLLLKKKKQLKKCLEQTVEEDTKKIWNSEDFPWSSKLNELKTSIFNISHFRPLQLSTINITLSNKDCILIMPTGGGKSLCFQLPALISEGVTLVISPLISLMEDQLMALKDLNISASMLSSSCTKDHNNKVHTAMIDKKSDLKLLYVTPERLAKSKMFMNKLEKMYELGRLSRIVIDEVHCCSQWGHDFRPDYKMLGIMKRQFPKVAILGLTATATTHVTEDVKKILNLPVCMVLKATFNRPNLFYEVRLKPSSHQEQIEELSKIILSRFSGQSGIIYCFSTKDTEGVARDLRKRNIKAHHYHAYVEPQLRSSVHRKWVTNEIQIVVATIAFGMGINKSNVRFVIHHSLSKSIENYYQESGRAGRDDKPAHCLLYYQCADIFRQSTMVFTEQTGLENLYKMVAYCHDLTRCRRQLIAEHFGEGWKSDQCNEMCDHCKKQGVLEKRDIRKQCLTVLKIMEASSRKDVRLTANKLIDAWKKDPYEGQFRKETYERIIIHLLLESYLKEDFHFTPYNTICYLVPGPRASFAADPDHSITMAVLSKSSSHNSNHSSSSASPIITPQNTNKQMSLNSLVLEKQAKKLRTNKGQIKKKKMKQIIISDDDDSDIETGKINSFTKSDMANNLTESTVSVLDIDNDFCDPPNLLKSKITNSKKETHKHHHKMENIKSLKSKKCKSLESCDSEETFIKKPKLDLIDIADEL